MFNKSFNLTAYINDLRSLALKRAAFSSLANTLSWRICTAADRMVDQLLKKEYSHDELKELSAREVLALLAGPQTGPGNDELRELRKIWKLYNEYMHTIDMYTIEPTSRKEGDKPQYGSIRSTLDTMTGPQRERLVDNKKIEEAKSVGFTYTPEEIKASVADKLRQDNHWAGIRAKRVGFTEWIIDQLFAQVVDDEDDENYSQLSAVDKEFLCAKLQAFCNTTILRIKHDFLYNKTSINGLGLSDAILLQRCAAELPDMIYVSAARKTIKAAKAPVDKAVTVKAKRVRKVKAPTVTRAPAPTQATKVTETLDNGFKVTRAATTA